MLMFCKIYINGECKDSVEQAEMFQYGIIQSNTSVCGDFNIRTDDDPFNMVYNDLTFENKLAVAHQPKVQ